MSRKIKTLNVTIMEKEYPVACPPGQEATLMAAVDQVDKLMHTIKRNGRTVGVERIAVMAALNMTHELLDLKEKIKTERHAQTTGETPMTEAQASAQSPEHDAQEAEKLQQIAEEEAAIAKQLQALTEKLESALKSDNTPTQPNQPSETQASDASNETSEQDTKQDTTEAANSTAPAKTAAESSTSPDESPTGATAEPSAPAEQPNETAQAQTTHSTPTETKAHAE